MTKPTRAPSNARSPLTGRRHKGSPGPVIISAEDLRNWQRVRAMQLHAEGWTDTRICAEIGIGRTTFRDWLRHANIPDRRGRLGKEKLKEKQRQFFELRKQHPDDWITFQFSELLGVHSKRLMKWAREIDDPLPHRTYSYRYHKHEARIRQWIAEKKTFRWMEKMLRGEGHGVTFSGIAQYAKRLGLKSTKRGSGERVNRFDEDIGVNAEGKGGKEIVDELQLSISASSVNRCIKKLNSKNKPCVGL